MKSPYKTLGFVLATAFAIGIIMMIAFGVPTGGDQPNASDMPVTRDGTGNDN
jgi:hypothetical protein